MRPTIVVANKSTILPQRDFLSMVAAVQVQIDRDFSKAWHGLSALLVPSPGLAPDDAWRIEFTDKAPADVEGAAGYHDQEKSGAPRAFVFTGIDKRYSLASSVTFSHEVIEIILDPFTDLAHVGQRELIALEACDPVEDDVDSYLINGVRVSNFIYPSWFHAGYKRPPYDHHRLLTAPLQIRKTGYASKMALGRAGIWRDVTGPLARRWQVKQEERPDSTRVAKRNRKTETQVYGIIGAPADVPETEITVQP